MLNLYKSDLLRIIKDKLFTVVLIIAGVFALFNPILYYAIFKLLGTDDTVSLEILGMLNINAKGLFFTSFIPGDNLGLIAPILISVAMCKEFSQGTIRNKIIAGHSRTKLFFSSYFSATTVTCALMLAHALLTLFISLIFLDYQNGAFSWNDFGFLMLSILFEIILYLAISAIMCLVVVITQNIGLCIVGYLAVSFISTFVGSIIQSAYMFTTPEDKTYGVLKFFNNINIYTSNLIGVGTSYSLENVLYIVLPPVIIAISAICLGVLSFRKKDLK